MYDWANCRLALTITCAVFPIFYVAATTRLWWERTSSWTSTRCAAAAALSLGARPWVSSSVALIAPILSGIADHRGNKKQFPPVLLLPRRPVLRRPGVLHARPFLGRGWRWWRVACIGFSGSLIFYDAFLPEIAEKKDHDRISARGYTMGYIGSVILLIFNLAMVMKPDLFGLSQDHHAVRARVGRCAGARRLHHAWRCGGWAGRRSLPPPAAGDSRPTTRGVNVYQRLPRAAQDLERTAPHHAPRSATCWPTSSSTRASRP